MQDETRKPQDVKAGDVVQFVDAKGVAHLALVTQVWRQNYPGTEQGIPGLNVVYVSSDETKQDSYGTQLERATSVIHKSVQPAGGYYWTGL